MTRRKLLENAFLFTALSPQSDELTDSDALLSEPIDEDATYMLVLQPKADLSGKVIRQIQEGADHFFQARFPGVKIVPIVIPSDCDAKLYKVAE